MISHTACYAKIIIQFATVEEIDKPFTYAVPTDLIPFIQVGQRVYVPFGRHNHLQVGYVLGLSDTREETKFRIKEVRQIIDERPLLSPHQLELIEFIVSYYGTSYAAAIDVVLPPGLKGEPIAMEKEVEEVIKLSSDTIKVKVYCHAHEHKKTFLKQQQIIEYLRDKEKIPLKVLENIEGISKSSIKTLLQNEIIEKHLERIEYIEEPIHLEAFRNLNEEQAHAVSYLEYLGASGNSHTVLLEGVTGSGKTEVFLHAIKNVIEKGQTALVLVPEIALTQQTLSRFKERFGSRVALSHSRMSAKERQRLYMRAKKGEVSIIIGPRSAVFMPLENLKLIVIDEAHEATYKSETPPKYHAIDIAKKRMEMEGGVVLLATATPSMESYYQSENGEYELLKLTKRIAGATMPSVEIVDMRQELATGNNTVLSRRLYKSIHEALENGGQVMLLINRRGHSTFINCRSCGHVVKCNHCDVSMTYHLSTGALECHYCGKTEKVPEVCPECGSKYIRFFGTGTEKVEAYLKEHFDAYGVGRMDLDTTTGKEGHAKILEAFRRREFNLLIGTQMIAKGHDFPGVTLVGILSADQSLYMQDFRSNERTFQLLTQAMGRAGRGNMKGKVIIQTYTPEHMVMDVIKNNKQELFYKQELLNRKTMGYPPYTHIFSLLITGPNENEVIQTAHQLTAYYRHYSERGVMKFRVIGPSVAVISKIGDVYRWRLLIIGEERSSLLIYGKFCLDKFYQRETTNNIKIGWDIDPLTML